LNGGCAHPDPSRLTGQSVYRAYRGVFGAGRPAALDGVALPPAPMAAHRGGRPIKAWRYVGVFGPEVMICAAVVRIGPARQSFWAVWDRVGARLHEHTTLGRGDVRMARGCVDVDGHGVRLHLTLDEGAGIETVSPSGAAYAWTRKQGGMAAAGTLAIGGGPERAFAARAVIDDTAAYYPRHTRWWWSAGVGQARDGRAVAWNLVDGVNDAATGSERTVWIDGEPAEVGPVRFAPDLSAVTALGVRSSPGPGRAPAGALRFHPEAERTRRENLLLVRSRYRQPFGTFDGELPGGVDLTTGYGVMEDHDVYW
jgi:hypothetical protein